jgi:hypothetical protein
LHPADTSSNLPAAQLQQGLAGCSRQQRSIVVAPVIAIRAQSCSSMLFLASCDAVSSCSQLDMPLDMHTLQLDTKTCNWTCLDMQLDILLTIVVVALTGVLVPNRQWGSRVVALTGVLVPNRQWGSSTRHHIALRTLFHRATAAQTPHCPPHPVSLGNSSTDTTLPSAPCFIGQQQKHRHHYSVH